MKNNLFNFSTLIKFMDLLILLIVMAYLINDFMSCYISCINNIDNIFNLDVICNMTNNVNTSQTHTTEVKIIHDDGSWSNAIRSLFIYGTGAFRLNLIRNGGSGNKAFVIASTLATDITTKFINNTVNNPEYIKAHYNSWKYIWNNTNKGTANVIVDDETAERLNQVLLSNNFTSDGSGMDDISEKIMKFIFETIGPILQPVASPYSTEVLAEQIYHISILLFILSLLISILIFSLLFNVFISINSERILKFFNNKYIRWYININLKFIAIELFFLGGSILFFMYDLSKGLHYIATHPIIIS